MRGDQTINEGRSNFHFKIHVTSNIVFAVGLCFLSLIVM